MSGSSDMVVRGSLAWRQTVLTRLYEEHFRDVWGWVSTFGVRVADQRDVVHDVFVAAWHGLESFEGRSTYRTWLFSIATNVARQRRARAYLRREVQGDLDDAQHVGHDPEQSTAVNEARALLDRMLDALPEEQRETFLLFELGEMTGATIAELTEVPLQTVFSRLRAARAHVENQSWALRDACKKDP